MSNSYTPPDRSTYDPGWNDPPPMPTMTPQIPVPGKPRLNLNKRVAFPMQSSAASSSNVKTTAEGLPLPFSTAKYQPPPVSAVPEPQSTSSPQAVLPPLPPPPTVLNPSAPNPTSIMQPLEEVFNSSEAQQFCHSIFNRLVDTMRTNTEENKLNEIKKRLESLEQMWQENKLHESAQKNLYQLAKALDTRDTGAAMEQHRLLATQHINVSTQWATALRQLILSLSSESELDAQNAPAILPDTEVVQFVDVSTKPIVVDSVPSFPQDATSVNTAPVLMTNDSTTDTQQENACDNNSNENANTENATNQNASKSKFGRFGRILHI